VSINCASPPPSTLFCADFDAVSDPATGWTNTNAWGLGATGSLDTVDYASAPASFQASLIQGSSTTAVSAYFFDFNTSSERATATLSFSFRLHQGSTVDDAWFAWLGMPDAGSTMRVRVTPAGNLVVFEEAPFGVTALHDLGPISLDTWYAVAVVLDDTKIQTYLDGTLVVDTTPTATAPIGSRYLAMGLMGQHSIGGPTEIELDDIVLTNP
jgi:hypothetical protein